MPAPAAPAAPEAPEKDGGVRAVERALDILSAFATGDSELLVADLQKRVGLSRPTLYRLLRTLEKKGFVTGGGEPQRFHLGPALGRIANVWVANLDLAALARPVLNDVWAHTRETVALFVPRGDMRLCIAELRSPQPLSFSRGIGSSERLVKGASGRAILAFTPLAEGEIEQFAAGTAVDVAWTRKQLELTRERGYAMGHNELIQGAWAVAAPFFDATGAIAGSVAVFGPDVRLTEAQVHEFGRYLGKAASGISRALGWDS
ncbi:IclR family transcriptional regulator [Ramlibacter sp.]|uniref:IclR family transcriptional regulator n=1 Tax=Ramlibacter sp. TaxID=1917967 RepID=UPI003D1426FF